MFIYEGDVIEIIIYCKKNKINRYEAVTESEYKALKEEDKKKYTPTKVKMREMTWGLFNQLQDEAMVEGTNGESKFNYRKYKENRLKRLLKEWDAKDKDGKDVAISENTISHLVPAIAEAILRAYDEASFLSEDEEGK